MFTLDTILVALAIVLAGCFVVWRFWRKSQGKGECCGKGCGCVFPKKSAKIPVKKA